ncbi:hypothetical protein BO78DRAFT_219233 [Aspergillus sclerotiicarbonarius CBS 121057]|uniref:Uncharacterized protein n=1 Tax=Aspergillus sclerotiicarbonarius (strain CBS 121057 / IBT 28362) TaxID=1448318 RepID=A0A319ET87_ASPSB|nr:hypothetical protein BO78DRAFT_219233 [Aspergillus sclerotiicarbonarius CBS 121057]
MFEKILFFKSLLHCTTELLGTSHSGFVLSTWAVLVRVLLVFGFFFFISFFFPLLSLPLLKNSFFILFFSFLFSIFHSLYVIFSEVDCEGPVQSSLVLSFLRLIFFSQVYGYTSLDHVEPVWKSNSKI